MENESRRSLAVAGFVVAGVVVIAILVASHQDRHKHHSRVIKTKSHNVYVENDDGSTFQFFPDGGGDVALPRLGDNSFRLPKGSWAKADRPAEEEIEESEETQLEESDAGEPEADTSGDIGANSEGASSSDSGSGDSGGSDSGGDGGGGDGE